MDATTYTQGHLIDFYFGTETLNISLCQINIANFNDIIISNHCILLADLMKLSYSKAAPPIPPSFTNAFVGLPIQLNANSIWD